MPLTFVNRTESFSTYLDCSGNTIALAHGFPRRRLMLRHEITTAVILDLVSEIQADGFSSWSIPSQLVTRLAELSAVPSYLLWQLFTRCDDCQDFESREELSGETLSSGSYYCDACLVNLPCCDDCGDRDELHETANGQGNSVCQSCLENSYTYCDDCDTYYRDGEHGDHDSSECIADRQSFAFLGLDAETIGELNVPGGSVDIGTRRAIDGLLYSHDDTRELAYIATERIGTDYVTDRGTYAKRLRAFAHKHNGTTIPADMLEKIGNMARTASLPVSHYVAWTRDFNRSAAAFAHEGSCYWQSYAYSRCTLKGCGAFAVRSFSSSDARQESGGRDVTGRAWIVPLDSELEATPDVDSGTYLVLNAYGRLTTTDVARALAARLGLDYKRIGVSAYAAYINGENGYIVGTPEQLEELNHVSLDYSPDCGCSATQHI